MYKRQNEQKRLDVISNNMANSNTVGYKDEKVASQAFDQVLGIKTVSYTHLDVYKRQL